MTVLHWNVTGVPVAFHTAPACARVSVPPMINGRAVPRRYRVTTDPAAVTCKRCLRTTAFKLGKEVARATASMKGAYPNAERLTKRPLPNGYGRRYGDAQLRSHGSNPHGWEWESMTTLGALRVATTRLLRWAEIVATRLPESDREGAEARGHVRRVLKRLES